MHRIVSINGIYFAFNDRNLCLSDLKCRDFQSR